MRAVDSPRLRFAGRPFFAARKEGCFFGDFSLSAEGEEGVVERSKDRVSQLLKQPKQLINQSPIN
jgi:hypothetical protein